MEAKQRKRLCLSRKAGQSVVIDGPAEVIVHQIRAGHVRLTIEAPETTTVKRQELQGPRERAA